MPSCSEMLPCILEFLAFQKSVRGDPSQKAASFYLSINTPGFSGEGGTGAFSKLNKVSICC